MTQEQEHTIPQDPELTYEQRIAKAYRDLGRKIKNLQDERDALKATEIDPMINDGVVLDYGGECIVPEHIHKTDFDWERLVSDGLITIEQAQAYITVKVERRLMFRKVADSGKVAFDAYLASCAYAYDQYKKDKDEAAKAAKKKETEK